MKKFLLTCFLAFGIGASAQVLVHESFESGGTTFPGFTTTSLSNFTLTGSACESTVGKQALGRALTSTATTAVLEYNSATAGAATNGKKIDISVNNQQWGTTVGGTIKIEYAVGTSTTFTAVPGSTPVTFSAATSCQTISGTIPEGTIPAGTGVKIRITTTRSSGNFTALYDAISIVQEVTEIPACTTFTFPTNGAENVSVRPTVKWGASIGAEYYKLKIGTSAGASDVLNIQVAGTTYTPSLNTIFPQNTTLYASVTPTNAIGDATGCTSEISFTTGANPFLPFCGPIIGAAGATYPISSVTFAGVTNTSSAAVGGSGHESFTETKFELLTNSTYSINIVGTGLGTNRFAAVVFIDWNNNGSFADAGETYFNTTPFLYAFTSPNNTLNSSIAVPAGAVLDTDLRMRIKYNYVGTTNPTSLPAFMTDPCADLGNGQAEDYTIVVKDPVTVPPCTTITDPANGSTNFPSNSTITWNSISGATGYKLYIGTTSGGTDIANGLLVTTTSYAPNLNPLTKYYVKVVPTNNIGDATGCAEISFTTANFVYCSAAATSTSFEKIGNVSILNTVLNNSSTSNAGYEDFTALAPADLNTLNTYSISVAITGFDADETIVWIDYNQNGNFEDSEKTVLTAAEIAQGNITIPESAKLGNTRMRVRMHYTLTGSNATPCGTSTFGQVEDYTVNILPKITQATTNVTKDLISVYPNPFQDILKISDVKGVKSITISDISGRLVKSMKASTELHLADLRAGLYIVTLHMNDGTVKAVKAIKK